MVARSGGLPTEPPLAGDEEGGEAASAEGYEGVLKRSELHRFR